MSQGISPHDPREHDPRVTESVGELVGEILRDGQKLVQQELLLFRTELQQQWTKAKAAALMGSLAAVAAVACAITLILCLVHGLSAAAGLPLWASYGLFAVALAVGLGFLAFRARELAKEIELVPRQTVETVKENVRWFKKRM